MWVRQGLPARPLESLLCQPTHSYPPTPVSSVTSRHESRRRCKVESANRLSAQRVRCSRSRINLLPPSINAPRSNSFSQGLSMHRFFHCILSPTAFPPFPHLYLAYQWSLNYPEKTTNDEILFGKMSDLDLRLDFPKRYCAGYQIEMFVPSGRSDSGSVEEFRYRLYTISRSQSKIC